MAKRFLGFLALLIAASLYGSTVHAAQRPEQGAATRLLGSVDALIDQTGMLAVEDIAAGRGGTWARLTSVEPRTPLNQTVVWYRFIPHRINDDALAIKWPSVVGRIDLYCKGPAGFEHHTGGYDAPVKSLTEHIMLIPEGALGRLCYLRAVTGFANSSPRLLPLQAALGEDTPLTTTFGGFFLAIALFNVVLFFVMRERSLLLFAGVMLMLIGLFASDDALWRVLPSTPLVRMLAHALFGWLYFAGTAFFSREFLGLREDDPPIDRWIVVLTVATLLGIPSDVLQLPRWVDLISQALIVALLILLVIAGIRSARRGFRPARFFIAGSAGVVVGTVVNLAVMDWQLPLPSWSVYLFEISIAWEALWLTVALADRMRDLNLENAALQVSRAQLRRLAERDPLTGVANRRAFDDRLAEEWDRASRAGTPLGLIMLDVDHFKAYNDALGHIAGDDCLCRIAEICSATLKRNVDFFARYGGEEFAAILVAPAKDDLALLAERMRAAVDGAGIVHPAQPAGIVTISLGAAIFDPSPVEKPGELVAAADAALYEAKSFGRNRVRVAR